MQFAASEVIQRAPSSQVKQLNSQFKKKVSQFSDTIINKLIQSDFYLVEF